MGDSEKKKAWTKIYRQIPEVKEKYRVYNRKWAEEHKEQRYQSRRALQLKQKYGLTPADFDAILLSQDNKCACCGTLEFGPKGPVVDHCHSTGVVRGILCMQCNIGAGAVGDDPDVAIKLAEYLRKSKEKQ